MAPASIAHTAVKVTLIPTGRSTVSVISPVTGPAVQVAPLEGTQVHVQERAAGNVSVTVAPEASSGPAFDTTIV